MSFTIEKQHSKIKNDLGKKKLIRIYVMDDYPGSLL